MVCYGIWNMDIVGKSKQIIDINDDYVMQKKEKVVIVEESCKKRKDANSEDLQDRLDKL